MKAYDYIIIGGGASGLMLAEAMGSDPWFRSKRIALIEQEKEKTNDRTWCFWEKGEGRFDPILFRSWDHVTVGGPGFRRKAHLAPYRYKMLRGEDFYREFGNRIAGHPHIDRIYARAETLEDTGNHAVVHTSQGSFRAPMVFSSVLLPPPPDLMQPHPVLQQHFKGWFIRSENPVFDPQAPTFMDFDIPQDGLTRFMYVLPFSPTEALVEYTLFSEDLLEDDAYEAALEAYISGTLGSTGYDILETEKGSIPMTINDFTKANSAHICHIGIAGGWAKPSTGYTFSNTSRNIPRLLDRIKRGKVPVLRQPGRFRLYDRLLLDALAHENHLGQRIFSAQLERLPIPLLLTFLNEESSLMGDLRIITSCPMGPFLRATWRALFKSPS